MNFLRLLGRGKAEKYQQFLMVSNRMMIAQQINASEMAYLHLLSKIILDLQGNSVG
jgi:hypothetical protein